MAARKKRHGKERVKKDPLDIRDIYYEPTLAEIPKTVDNWQKVPEVLNQASEGACVGFAAAAVVNYLLANRSDRKKGGFESVSPRMLYEMARRYDEWEGEDYDGSSVRGAMKGWFNHGVCRESLWRYQVGNEGRFTVDAAMNAREQPLGAYYRVHHRRLNHMHAALHETGALIASAAVHSGWDDVDADGYIPYRREVDGGHAFAIIGYDEEGFVLQNSWGTSWGWDGFGHLSYSDWLEHGWDCWVARVGATIAGLTSGAASVSARSRFEYIPYTEVDGSDIRGHVVHLGDDGALKANGRFGTDREDVEDLFGKLMPEETKSWAKRRLLLYAHGGLNDAKASAARIASMKPYLLENEIYPVHFMWETGFWDSVVGAIGSALRGRRAEGVLDRATDLIDEAIELGARPLGKPVWGEMKQNARLASEDGGGATQVVDQLAKAIAAIGAVELHLVGHSAGSIFQAHLLERLVAAAIPVKSLILFAPACTTSLFRQAIKPNAGSVDRLAVFNLTDEAERDDSVAAYRKSLLYLVSESFEPARHEKLLGLQKHLDGDTPIRGLLGAPKVTSATTAVSLRGIATTGISSDSETHGGFDNDDATLNSMLRIILKAKPTRPF